jgi:hypothetical protein
MLCDLISKLCERSIIKKPLQSKNPLQSFIYKYIADSTIVQRCYEERKREKEGEFKGYQVSTKYRCQKSLHLNNRPPLISQPWQFGGRVKEVVVQLEVTRVMFLEGAQSPMFSQTRI